LSNEKVNKPLGRVRKEITTLSDVECMMEERLSVVIHAKW
jgi:hypothetical protein